MPLSTFSSERCILRHPVRALAALYALCLALSACAVAVAAFALPPQYADTFGAELVEKCALLEASPAPRIVIVGGSAAAFGIDSALLEGELPAYACVNLGTYAAFGTVPLLDMVQKRLAAGDIVIVSPELSEQTLSTFADGPELLRATERRPSLLVPLLAHGDTARALWAALLPFAAEKARLLTLCKSPST